MPRFPAKVNLINLPKKPKSLFSINRSPNTRVPTTVTADDCQISEPEVDPRIEISSHDHRDESPRSSIQTKKSNKIGHKRTSKEPREVILNQRQQQITNGLNYFYQLLTFSSRIMGAGLREDDDLLNDEDEASHDFEGFSKEVIHNHQLKLLEDEIVSSSEDDIDQHKSDTEVEGLLDSSPDITQSELDIQAISTVGEDAKSAQETLNLSPLVQKSSETTKKSRDLLVSQSPNTVLEKGAKTSSVQDDDEDHQTSIKGINLSICLMINDINPSVLVFFAKQISMSMQLKVKLFMLCQSLQTKLIKKQKRRSVEQQGKTKDDITVSMKTMLYLLLKME